MTTKSTPRKYVRTAKQIAEEKRIHEMYGRWRPTLEDLAKTGEYDGPYLQGTILDVMSFAARFKALRRKLRLSLAQVSARSGIDRAAISRFETGQTHNPTIHTLDRLASAVGMRLRIGMEELSEQKRPAKPKLPRRSRIA